MNTGTTEEIRRIERIASSNEFWTLSSGDHLNMIDFLLDELVKVRFELAEKDKVLREYAAVGAGTGKWARKILSQYATESKPDTATTSLG